MNAEYDKGYQTGYDAGYKRAMLDYGLEDDKPCEDAVSRQAVIEITAETGALETQTRVKSLPPATPKQRTGKWVAGQTIGDGIICSECNTHYQMYPMIYQFCPNCGAKMEGE